MKKVLTVGAAVLLLLLLSPFLLAHILGKVEAIQVKQEIFDHVLEAQSQPPSSFRSFRYRLTGFGDAGAEYGCYYSPDDSYRNAGTPYKNGYLQYGRPNSGGDRYYHERICENWFYYERHFG